MTLQSQTSPTHPAHRRRTPGPKPIAGYDKWEALRMEDVMLDAMAAPETPPHKGCKMQDRLLKVLAQHGAMEVRSMAVIVGIGHRNIQKYMRRMESIGAVRGDRAHGRPAIIWSVAKGQGDD